jgi:hypothetical protein
MRNQGFTKIGIIVVIFLAIVVIVGDVFFIRYLNNKTRDLQVLAEVKQIRSGLEAYSFMNKFYPEQTAAVKLNDSYAGTEKLCDSGFKRISDSCLKNIINPIPNQYLAQGNTYKYQSVDNSNDYLLEFNLITDFKELNLVKGKNCANNRQIISKTCF